MAATESCFKTPRPWVATTSLFYVVVAISQDRTTTYTRKQRMRR